MKTLGMEQITLDSCIQEAQRDRIVVTRNGVPVALVVGIEGMDEEQAQLSSSEDFWKLIGERRQQKTMNRAELERKIDAEDGARSP